MSKEKKEKSTPTTKHISYFSYFNHQLYNNQTYTQYDDNTSKTYINSYQSTEESSSNNSDTSINSIENEDKFIPLHLLDLSPTKKPNTNITSSHNLEVKETTNSSKQIIKPELQKYILPKYLFDSSKNKNKNKQNENKTSTSYITANDSSYSPTYVNQLNIYQAPFNAKIKVVPVILMNNPSLYLNYNKFNTMGNCEDFAGNEKKKKKKKKEFVEREGDWPCYRCKNLNFAFREKCNKCQMTRDESEKKFYEVGEELLKLADLSIYNKA